MNVKKLLRFSRRSEPALAAWHLLLRQPAVADNAALEANSPKADPPKRKRRWFQFSLRTLFVVVTLIAGACAYVGWQARIVRDRKAALQRLEEVDQGRYWACEPDSWLRRMLGDETVNAIIVPIDTSLEERRSLRVEFPEARYGLLHRIDGTHFLGDFPDDPNPMEE